MQHVFECSEHPTDLSPLDLWTRPSTAAEFLRTLPFFDLPEEERPPQNLHLQITPTETERNFGYKRKRKNPAVSAGR